MPTLDEAIEIKLNWRRNQKADLPAPFAQADNLSIEALKRLEEWRKGTVLNPDYMLPGETPERG